MLENIMYYLLWDLESFEEAIKKCNSEAGKLQENYIDLFLKRDTISYLLKKFEEVPKGWSYRGPFSARFRKLDEKYQKISESVQKDKEQYLKALDGHIKKRLAKYDLYLTGPEDIEALEFSDMLGLRTSLEILLVELIKVNEEFKVEEYRKKLKKLDINLKTLASFFVSKFGRGGNIDDRLLELYGDNYYWWWHLDKIEDKK